MSTENRADMEWHKLFFKKLIEQKLRPVTKSEEAMLDELAAEQYVMELFQEIEKKQNQMLEIWKRRNKIEAFRNYQLKIPNGTVGKYYELFFDKHDPVFDNIEILEVVIPAGLGLEYYPDERKLHGYFKYPGDTQLIIRFRLTDASPEEKIHEKPLAIIINPDPKSLWKDLPSDRTDSHWKEDNQSVSGAFGSKQLIIGSKRGRSHAHEGKFRDDGFAYSFDPASNWGVIAVADGAGSAKFSRRGSDIACSTVIDYFQQFEKVQHDFIDALIEREIEEPGEESQRGISLFCVEHLGKAAFEAHKKIKMEAEGRQAVMRDFHTTLIFALIRQIKEKWFIASFWVGDGGIGIYDKPGGTVTVPGTPDSGEFAGQTRFLTMPEIFAQDEYIARIKYKILDDFTALFLMTDGITDPKFQTDGNLDRIEYWNALWEDLLGGNEEGISIANNGDLKVSEDNLMKWMDFWSPGNHDDRTIAILF
jgi:serine/threonine protein phosphatase PrpC